MRRWMGLSLVLALWGSAAVLRAGAATQPPEMIQDGGFENGDTAGIGRSWGNESYGDGAVQFDLSTDNVQFGKYCQHIRVQNRKDDGYAQICQMGMKVQKGQQYSIGLWMRGNPSGPVLVGFRKQAAPYTFYLKQEVRITPAWKHYTITGITSDADENAGLYLGYSGNGNLWIDNVSARATSGSPPAADHPATP